MRDSARTRKKSSNSKNGLRFLKNWKSIYENQMNISWSTKNIYFFIAIFDCTKYCKIGKSFYAF
jgi:hypothetical protein